LTKISCLLLLTIFFITCSSNSKDLTWKLSIENKTKLEVSISRQLNFPLVKILRAYKYEEWSLFYVDTHETDEVFLFYKSNPFLNKYESLWSGVALKTEKEQIRNWTVKNIPGIPSALVDCFVEQAISKTRSISK